MLDRESESTREVFTAKSRWHRHLGRQWRGRTTPHMLSHYPLIQHRNASPKHLRRIRKFSCQDKHWSRTTQPSQARKWDTSEFLKHWCPQAPRWERATITRRSSVHRSTQAPPYDGTMTLRFQVKWWPSRWLQAGIRTTQNNPSSSSLWRRLTWEDWIAIQRI